MKHRPRSESGFALLLVFAMAAIMAVSLYYAMPRVAFESQRDKEALLIARGEEYKRAIQLYVRKNKRWPAKMEDLENTGGLRFLRRRYVDPMTGKAEWRLVHVGPNGVLTDSLVKPLKKDDKDSKNANNFITELQPMGGTDAPGNANPAMRRRPSDQTPTEGNGVPNPQPDQTAEGQPPPVPQPVQPPNGPNGLPPAGFSNANFPNAQLVNGNPAGQPLTGQVLPGQNMPGQNPNNPFAGRLGQYPGPPVNSQTGGISQLGGLGSSGAPPVGYSTQPGVNGQTPPPFPQQFQGQAQGQVLSAQQPTDAARLIQGLLTSPRPGGLAGIQNQSPGQVMGGGIAGVATTYEGTGIKIYNDQGEYKKWEFVYDMSKDKNITGGQTQSGLQNGGLNGQGTLNGQPNPNLNGQPIAPANPATVGTPIQK